MLEIEKQRRFVLGAVVLGFHQRREGRPKPNRNKRHKEMLASRNVLYVHSLYMDDIEEYFLKKKGQVLWSWLN
jgi:hypothetical protein